MPCFASAPRHDALNTSIQHTSGGHAPVPACLLDSDVGGLRGRGAPGGSDGYDRAGAAASSSASGPQGSGSSSSSAGRAILGGHTSQISGSLTMFVDSDDEQAGAGAGSGSGSGFATAPKRQAVNSSALCVFKVAHKNPAGLKRPLASVDNLRFGDIAIQAYVAETVDDGKLQVRRSQEPIQLLRLLSSAEASLEKHLKCWSVAGSAVVNTLQDDLTSEAWDLIQDMVGARAFAGSPRHFQLPDGCDQEMDTAIKSLEERGLVQRASAEVLQSGTKRRRRFDSADGLDAWVLTGTAVAAFRVSWLSG